MFLFTQILRIFERVRVYKHLYNYAVAKHIMNKVMKDKKLK